MPASQSRSRTQSRGRTRPARSVSSTGSVNGEVDDTIRRSGGGSASRRRQRPQSQSYQQQPPQQQQQQLSRNQQKQARGGLGLPGIDEMDDDIASRNGDKDDGAGDDTLKLRLDINLDVAVELRAKVHGDVTLSLLN